MSVFKCKMCGGTLEFNTGDTVGVCDSCGTKQTLPKTNDDVIANLFNRANNLRLKCEFDKAEQIYEKIVEQNAEDCEAHWGIILCKYGIEYVEDPKTLSRVPTCHRTLFEAVTTDADYLAAIAKADDAQKEIYQNEAREIDKIQKNILAIVKNEKPFDVFICYKETDENGKRTVDSTVANDIYYQLTKEGLKVFYAAITLENKLGQEYEPYIFAALNSAKVMLVIGTKPEYFEAVWVKNEWSRFLNLMKTDRNKLLIPCYRDMDAYDLPEAFAHLQAQDMGKIGFINDLIHGIKKMTKTESAAAPQSETAPSAGNITPLLKRAKMFLEDGEWQKADDFCEQVLNQDPECAEAYLYKLMAEQHARDREDLPDLALPFDNSNYYEKIQRFGDDALKNEIAGYVAHIKERNEYEEKDEIYENAVSLMDAAKTEFDFKAAAAKFAEIPEHRDAEKLKEDCLEKAEISRKDTIYTKARTLMKYGVISDYEEAATLFQSISGWKDSNEQIYACQKGIEEIKAKEEADRIAAEREEEKRRIAAEKAAKKLKKIFAIGTPIVCACIAFLVLLNTVIIPRIKYNNAMKLIDSGDYEAAYALLEEIENTEAITSNKYDRAMKLIESGDYDSAYALLDEIGNTEAITSNKYDRAMKLIESGNYDSAYALLDEIGNSEAIASNKYDRAMELIESGDYDSAYALLDEIGNNEAIASNKYDRAMKFIDSGDYVSAYILLKGLSYKDSNEKLLGIRHEYEQSMMKNADVGNYVRFGSYEQDNDTSNGKEDIKWKILAKEDNRLLLISEKALDCKQYNTSRDKVTWETCSLRKWLNETFLNYAFNTNEQALIQNTTVSADKNPEYSTDPGNATTDKVFLLSIGEVNQYFSDNDARKCAATAYAIAQGAAIDISNPFNPRADYWLRSPGNNQYSAALVLSFGGVFSQGLAVDFVQRGFICVRPAIWVDLDA